MKNQRISILDGFRTLAIIPVVFFHFFSRWTQPFNDVSLYPMVLILTISYLGN